MLQNRSTVLFIGVHAPEPSTGAGTRMFYKLINFFSKTGFRVVLRVQQAENRTLLIGLEELYV